MNDKALSWVKSVKHIGSIVTWDLREVEEISKKRCDFIGRTNSLFANFKSILKEILSRVFLSQCCHMYGTQAWALDACYIKIFCSTGQKAIRKLWGLPNIARSALVPHLVNASPIEDQLYQRTAKIYNGIRKGHNPKLLLLLQLSTNADKMGIMGNNTRIISNRWLCGLNRLETTLSKAKAKKLPPEFLWSRISPLARSPDSLTSDEIVEMKNFIACYWPLSTFCPRVCWFHKWRNDVLVCILPLYVLTTVNGILLTILLDCNLSTKCLYIYICKANICLQRCEISHSFVQPSRQDHHNLLTNWLICCSISAPISQFSQHPEDHYTISIIGPILPNLVWCQQSCGSLWPN